MIAKVNGHSVSVASDSSAAERVQPFASEVRDGQLVIRPRFTWWLAVKYFLERMLALVLLLCFSPLILLAACLVKLTSDGPAFYYQERLGKDGRSFILIKLRSMVHEAESVTGPTWAGINDTRVTSVGRFLRETHIDELPQLINVVAGEMSLIGPRPERPELAAALQQKLPLFVQRLRIRPGLTGFAQLRLPPDTDLESVRRKLLHDLYYIQNANPWLDLRILLFTGYIFTKSVGAAAWRLIDLPSREAIERALLHGNQEQLSQLHAALESPQSRPETLGNGPPHHGPPPDANTARLR